jgi:hypothetical protein
MASRRLLGLLALLAACGPTSHPDTAAACAVVERFERALRQRDRGGLADSITRESREALDALTEKPVGDKLPLQILGAAPRADGILVRVHDPNGTARDAGFMVVRENGELRIDLIASAGLTITERPLPGGAERQVVLPLTPAQRAQAEAEAAKSAATAPR